MSLLCDQPFLEAQHEAETIIRRYDELEAELEERKRRAEEAEAKLMEAEARLMEVDQRALVLQEELDSTLVQVGGGVMGSLAKTMWGVTIVR